MSSLLEDSEAETTECSLLVRTSCKYNVAGHLQQRLNARQTHVKTLTFGSFTQIGLLRSRALSVRGIAGPHLWGRMIHSQYTLDVSWPQLPIPI